MMSFMRNNRVLLIVATVVIGLWFAFRTSATPLESVSALEDLLAQGDPAVLEFFGNT